MPYRSIQELPDSVRDNLPRHAQEIYQAAFNSAYDEYDLKGEEREQRAHQVAWSAVKNSYHKNDSGDWVKDEE